MARKLIIPGGTGFLGPLLARWFAARGWNVTIFSRSAKPVPEARVVRWDAATQGDWVGELEGADAVVNLAGRSVNCRYHARNREEILQSRVVSTRLLGAAIAGCTRPPRVWLNSSTATIYRHAEDRPMDEATGEIGVGFSVEVAQAWEAALAEADLPATRRVALRAAMVMGPQAGGPFVVFHRLARLGLGGTMGSGSQYVSWLHDDDFCRAIEWLIEREDFSGAVNLAAPTPIPNRDFMRDLRRASGAWIGLPATRWMLEVGAVFLRTETELPLKSRRVVPTRLLDAGFTFHHSAWPAAAEEIVARL